MTSDREAQEPLAALVEDLRLECSWLTGVHYDRAHELLDEIAALRERQAQGANPALNQVHRFLLGESDLDGVSFGERHPTIKGAFWWRTPLRAAIAASGNQADARSDEPEKSAGAEPVGGAPEPTAWISIEDRLPEMGQPVFALYPGGRIHFRVRGDDSDGWFWGNPYGSVCQTSDGRWECDPELDDDYSGVTHWMSMPSLPGVGSAATAKQPDTPEEKK